MRCFIQKELIDTLPGRVQLLQDITKLYMVKCISNTTRFFCYQSFPFNQHKDICIIYGHNNLVSELLNHNDDVTEKSIYLISCAKDYRPTYSVKKKDVYIAPQNEDDYLIPYKGSYFGFDFDITDVELNLYNCRKLGFEKALKNCFERL